MISPSQGQDRLDSGNKLQFDHDLSYAQAALSHSPASVVADRRLSLAIRPSISGCGQGVAEDDQGRWRSLADQLVT